MTRSFSIMENQQPTSDYVADKSSPDGISTAYSNASSKGSNGPLWALAGIMTGTQSRAEPVVEESPPVTLKKESSMVKVGQADEEERVYVKNSGTAQKRVHAVQLLFIGLLGLLMGWLGNFFVGTSCHFVSVPAQVGGGGSSFALHFGLWKYSPADSAMSGYSYCYPYSGSHDNEVPLVSRIANIVALSLGTYSLIVLWWYLVFGRANAAAWKIGVWTALLAAAAQMTTLYFFFDTLCQDRNCSWGPGSFLAIATAATWIIIGFELHYQAPMATRNAKADLENLEMSDLHSASIDYMDRFTSSPTTTKPEVSYTPPTAL